MRRLAVLSLSMLLAAPAFASFGSGGSSSPPEPQPGDQSMSQPADQQDAPTARQKAQQAYSDGYNEVGKGKDDLSNNKQKNADKHFKKALEHGREAVSIDSTYVEAWNLVGYCSRQLKDYDHSLAAYGRCLALNPNYAPAREYLGEAYLELNQPDKAREQLAALHQIGAADETMRLTGAIDDWNHAHPQAAAAAASAADSAAVVKAAPTASPTAATPDSTSAAGK